MIKLLHAVMSPHPLNSVSQNFVRKNHDYANIKKHRLEKKYFCCQIYVTLKKWISILCLICKVVTGMYVTTPIPYCNILTNKKEVNILFLFSRICYYISNKRPMGHIAYLRKRFKSINTYDYIIPLLKRRKKTLLS